MHGLGNAVAFTRISHVTDRHVQITQCDIHLGPTIDVLFAVIQTAKARVTIDELVDGFRQLESSIFERWPNVKERWHALQSGPPHQPQYETLWRRAD